jgi:torsin-1
MNQYADEIQKEIFAAIDKCPYSIFVFDEVDKMPEGIFDSISSILDHHSLVRGKDFKRAMFIFLTNYGGEEITKVLYQLTTKKGLYRHETKLHHFEEISKIGVYNRQGGLKESRLISSAVIDFYLPFLPLEEKHVIECIIAEFKKFNRPFVSQEMIDEIMNYIGFNSVTKYANTGCKTIHPKVRAECL